MNYALWLAVAGYLAQLLLIRWVLLLKKRQSPASVAWIFAIVGLPILGGLLFLIFGVNRVERRAARKQRASRAIARFLPTLTEYQVIPGEALSPQQHRLMRLATRVGETACLVGNQVEVLNDTNRTLGLIEQAVQAARETLHLEYYIWQPDKTGTRLRDLLIERARQGVQVRFLYDGLGSLRLSRRFLRPMYDAGIHVASFMPSARWTRFLSLNLRSHRKIVICDGQVGFTGGMNIGDEYIGRDPGIGYWRDTHLRLAGPIVLQLQQVFVEDWYYATGEELTHPEIFPPPSESGTIEAQVLAGEPSGDVFTFHSLMFAAINEAQHRILLTTSYFIPTDALTTALETAAHRGVRVRILVPGRGEYWWTRFAGRSFYQELLEAGVEIWEYQRGMLHSKTLMIDGEWSLGGSPNFDARSLMLNFEVGVAIYDTRVATALEDDFERDIKDAKRVVLGEWEQRRTWRLLAENTCRLFSPIL
ncbi:MAG: cardiolipin synthase [Planctomycetes bacterium]|nr:cardiolipin synthase [Planctomycetota bacterium]